MDRFRYTLIREGDQLKRIGFDLKWIQWNESGSFESIKPEIGKGRSLLLGPELGTWMTTPVEEVLVDTPIYKKFRTRNSIYELYVEIEEEYWDGYSDLPNVNFYVNKWKGQA